MSTPITVSAWVDVALEDALSEVQRRWPWMDVTVVGHGGAVSLVVRTALASGRIGLKKSVGDVWCPSPEFTDRSCPEADPASARTHARDILAVCDALDLAMSMVGDLRVQW